jgi:hypothetical protein
MIKMTLTLVVPFDDEVETLEDVCAEITDGTGLVWFTGVGHSAAFVGTREQIMMFLGSYDPDAIAADRN